MSSNGPHDGDPLAPHRGRLLGFAYRMLGDGGGRKPAALNPIIGAEKIAHLFIGLATKNLVTKNLATNNAGRDLRLVPTVINGSICALLYMDGEIDHTLSMAIDGDKIAAIYLVRNPDKLRHMPVARQ